MEANKQANVLVHRGNVPLHVPLAWHKRVLDPTIEYPGWQEYSTVLLYVYT